MTTTSAARTGRAVRREAAAARRAKQAELRRFAFEALAAGFPQATIARTKGVSVKTVRREIDRAIGERRLDTPRRYVHLQVARLTKALRLSDALVDRGDVRGVSALVKVVAALDRYHGLKRGSRPARLKAASAPLALPVPALKLTGAAAVEAGAPVAEGTGVRLKRRR